MTDKIKIPEKTVNDMKRLKQYFPYRVIFCIYEEVTNEFLTYAKTTKHTLNKALRDGKPCWTF